MKKILCLTLLIGFAYSSDGNDFLKYYPFDKDIDLMTTEEWGNFQYYNGIIHGTRIGTEKLAIKMIKDNAVSFEVGSLYFMGLRICNMSEEQIIRIIKKWCEDNPDKTHMSFSSIMLEAIMEISIDDSCL